MKAQDMRSAEVRAEGMCTDYSYGIIKGAGEERVEGSRVLEREARVGVHAWGCLPSGGLLTTTLPGSTHLCLNTQ